MHPHDEQHLGQFNYHPQQGFLTDFFPYAGENGYLQPIVAVQMDQYESNLLNMIYF